MKHSKTPKKLLIILAFGLILFFVFKWVPNFKFSNPLSSPSAPSSKSTLDSQENLTPTPGLTPSGKTPSPSTTSKIPKISPEVFTEEDTALDGNISVHRISYDASFFSPSSLEILKGDIVWFENKTTSPIVLEILNSADRQSYIAPKTLRSKERAEVAFSKTGNFTFLNQASPEEKGSIYVK